MSDVRVLTSVDRFQVRGQTAYVIGAIPDLNPRSLMGQRVLLDGREVIVAGVETNAVIDPTGTSFSVIVDRV